jgi:hypothetical protein
MDDPRQGTLTMKKTVKCILCHGCPQLRHNAVKLLPAAAARLACCCCAGPPQPCSLCCHCCCWCLSCLAVVVWLLWLHGAACCQNDQTLSPSSNSCCACCKSSLHCRCLRPQLVGPAATALVAQQVLHPTAQSLPAPEPRLRPPRTAAAQAVRHMS